jgi:hypothetical protein
MEMGKTPKRHKYGAEPITIDGIRFASKREAKRYGELKLLAKAGEIMGLEIQPEFPWALHNVPIFVYRADFAYWIKPKLGEMKKIIEDVKGVRTPLYKLKKKIIETEYFIEITEI